MMAAPASSPRRYGVVIAVRDGEIALPITRRKMPPQILETMEIVSEAGALAAMARGPQGRLGADCPPSATRRA
jgi:hypothetical protein